MTKQISVFHIPLEKIVCMWYIKHEFDIVIMSHCSRLTQITRKSFLEKGQDC